MKNVKILAGKQKRLFRVGIKADKFVPVSVERQKELKQEKIIMMLMESR